MTDMDFSPSIGPSRELEKIQNDTGAPKVLQRTRQGKWLLNLPKTKTEVPAEAPQAESTKLKEYNLQEWKLNTAYHAMHNKLPEYDIIEITRLEQPWRFDFLDQGEKRTTDRKFMQERYVTGIIADHSNKTTENIIIKIRARGQIPYSEFMQECLFGEDGYYSKGKVEIGGSEGHFITSPQQTHLFGAGIGKTAMGVWEAMGKPSSFDVIEMGAGQGEMAGGLLKWAREHQPGFYNAIRYQIVEIGDLIERQRQNLALYENEGKITWTRGSAHDQSSYKQSVQGVIVFNELMDAFPVDRLRSRNGKVEQKYVTLDEQNQWVELWGDPTPDVEKLLHYMNDKLRYKLPLGDTEVALNPESLKLQQILDEILETGAIINIDYGSNGKVGSKWWAAIRHFGSKADKKKMIEALPKDLGENPREDLNEHSPHSNLLWGYHSPGNVDITSDVNFAPLIAQAQKDGLDVAYAGTQRDLLLRVGIAEPYYEELKSTTSWDRYWALARTLNDLSQTLNLGRLGHFYSTILTKGIDPENLQQIKQVTDSRFAHFLTRF